MTTSAEAALMETTPYRDVVEFGVLGSLEIIGPTGRVELRGSRERLLLAHLLAANGLVVPVTTLIDGLWGEDPPRTAGKALQNIVLRVRRSLDPERAGRPGVLVTEPGGYRLVTEALRVDSQRFEALMRSATSLDPEARASTLREALALWRGDAFSGLTDPPAVAAEARRLTELRAAALEAWCEAELDAGPRSDLVAELESLVVEHPLRERLWALLIRALYQQGRQGEALGAFARARTVLASELGVDPGPELQQLHGRILSQDPGLARQLDGARIPPELRRTDGALVGRDEELGVLRDLWDRVRRGEGALVQLRSPMGAGARRLVAELARTAAASGAEVLFVSGTERAPEIPASTKPVLVVVDRAADAPVVDGRPVLVLSLANPSAEAEPGTIVLDLDPLDLEEIRRVVAPVVPPPLLQEVVAEVWPESGGWPGRAHHLATSAVQRRVADEVRSAAIRADAASNVLTEARNAMTAGVLHLGDRTGVADEGDGGTWGDVAPWPGLPAYGQAEAEWFAGRERLVAEMVARLPGSPSLAVVGASGSGKSSAVNAGLLAALREGRLPGSAGWRVLSLRPGAHPMGELARSLLHAGRADVGDLLEQLVRAPDGSADRWVLVVDQFEECWTECHDPGEREGFLDVLSGLVTDPSSRTTLVVVVRADFLPRVAEHGAMATALSDTTVLVGTPSADEVRRAVLAPAQRAGLILEDGLVDAIVADAGHEPGLLPLLSTTLRRLWEEREGRVLTLDAYVTGGGLKGAIAGLAESQYAALGPAHQAEARALLLRLAGSGEDDEVVRRRVRLDELGGLPRDVRPLIELLADARLVTVSGGSVEVAHEALFREWPRLRGWLGEDREGRAIQRRLALAATEWQHEGRDAALLWTGTRLDAAMDVARERPDELTVDERAFVAAAREAALERSQAAQRRAAEKARQNRRLRLLLIGTVAVLLVALLAGLLALRARDREAQAARTATRAAVAADAKRLAASALSMEQPDFALLTAVEATRLEQSAETYGAVLTLLGRHPDVVTRVSAETSFTAAAGDPRGRAVYLGQEAPALWAVDPETGERLWTRDLDAMGLTISASPDGRRVAVLVVDRSGEPPDQVVVFGPGGDELWRLPLDRINRWTGAEDPFVWENPTWRDDGTLVLATDSNVVTVGPDGSFLGSVPWGRRVFDTATFAVWSDGQVSTGPSEAGPGVLLDLSRARSRTVPDAATIWAVSPAADVLAATREASSGTELVMLDARTLRGMGPAWPVAGVVSFMRFSPDGRRVVAGIDERVEVRDARSGALESELSGQSSDALRADWGGPKNHRLWTAGREGTAVAFDVTGRHGVIATALSPDLPWAGEGAADAGAEIWSNRDDFGLDVAFLRREGDRRGAPLPLTGLGDCRCEVTSTDLSADGRTALAGVRVVAPDGGEVPGRGYVVVWDVVSRRVRALVDTPWPVQGVDSAAAGDVAVLNGGAGWGTLDLVRMQLAETAELPGWTRFGWGTSLVELSPDGDRAALLRGPRVLLVDVASGEVLREATVEPDPDSSLISAAWSTDGETLALGSATGRFYVVGGQRLQQAAPRRLLTGGPVSDIEVSPDGRIAATIEGADGDVVLWDTATWRPYGQAVLRDHGQGFLRFQPDSSHLEVVYGRGIRARVAAQPVAWVAAACTAANRELTADEVAVLDTTRPAGPTCPGAVTGR